MAAYTEMHALLNNADFQNRIQIASLSAANDVLAELSSTADHTLRLKWANNVLDGTPTMTIQEVTRYVCANASVITAGATIADASLKTVVTGLIPQFITKECE